MCWNRNCNSYHHRVDGSCSGTCLETSSSFGTGWFKRPELRTHFAGAASFLKFRQAWPFLNNSLGGRRRVDLIPVAFSWLVFILISRKSALFSFPWQTTFPFFAPQEIYKDRQKFSEQVFKVASSDLVNMGISVVSYTLKDIHDDQVGR